MQKLFTLLFLLLATCLSAQIVVSGTITDEKNNQLPYVSVYIKNTAYGTNSNENGNYKIEVSTKGNYEVVFQFLGYKTISKKITVSNRNQEVNIQMQPQEIALDEVVVSSKENPAIGIIKNTIASKNKNTKHLTNFSADFYSKGIMRIKNAPKKFMGQKIRFPFPLDSTRSGIIYLSETVSKIKSQKRPKKFKEHIIASKISGEDNGISFNQADEVDFNLYDNSINIAESNIISPIANTAFSNYRYSLLGTFYDGNANLINKIKIIPKLQNARVFSGNIYIVEDSWAIYGAELEISGKQLSNPGIKKLFIKQNYKYLPKIKAWNLIQQTIDFKLGMLSFNLNGKFSASYSNYNLKPKFTKKTFTNEILSFDKGATKKDSVYWTKLRPMPLTLEERKDYIVKDSIKVLKKSKKYLDSIDKKENKFNATNILFGYTYQNSYKKWNIGTRSLLENVEFNTVQGWNASIGGYFFKRLDEFGKQYSISSDVNFGFTDKKWRPTVSFGYKWNNLNKPILQILGGITTKQFNENKPISKLYNSIASVFFERNYMKIYEQKFAKIKFAKDIANGIRLFGEMGYMERNPLKNNTDYTMFNYKNRAYTSNNPISPINTNPSFSKHQIYKGQITTKIDFGNQYISLPNEKWSIGNRKYPTLYLQYRRLFGAKEKQLNSDLFVGVLKQQINLGNSGNFNYYIKGGIFSQKKNIAFMDYLHANGNRLPIVSETASNNSYRLLDYYALSTNDKQAQIHAEYNFKGMILNKIPLLNKLNFHLVVGGKSLFTADKKPYTEYAVGLDNIGFGKWRFLRVDYVRSNYVGKQKDGFVFSLNLL